MDIVLNPSKRQSHSANQLTGFYLMGTLPFNKLICRRIGYYYSHNKFFKDEKIYQKVKVIFTKVFNHLMLKNDQVYLKNLTV